MRAQCLGVGLVSLLVIVMAGCTPDSPPAGRVGSNTTIASNAVGPVNRTGVVAFAVMFDQDVTGFDDAANDVQLDHHGTSGGTVAIIPINGKTYAVTVTDVSGDGSFVLRVPAGAAQDGAGNDTSVGVGTPVTVDNTAPQVLAIGSVTPDGRYGLAAGIDVTVQFTEPVTLSGGPLRVSLTGGKTIVLEPFSAADRVAGLYTVVAGDNADPLDSLAIELDASGRVVDMAGNDGVVVMPAATLAGAHSIAVDTTGPVVTVNNLLTNNPTLMTGTVDDASAIVMVALAGQVYGAVNNGDGTWSLAQAAIVPLAEGVYDLAVTATDSVGNVGQDASQNEMTIDLRAPAVVVTRQNTVDVTPTLTGSVDDPGATVRVTVGGVTYTAVNNGDNTWTLNGNQIQPPLAEGTYDVAVEARDVAGNVGVDATVDELIVDLTPPKFTASKLVAKSKTPAITGTVSEPPAQLKVTIAGKSYAASVTGSDWLLPDNTIDPLADGTYAVILEAADAAGNLSEETIPDAVTIDTTAPVVTASPLATRELSPALAGTVNDPAAVVTVSVAGVTYAGVNDGLGAWQLAAGTIQPALGEGTYDVAVSAADPAGNVGQDGTAGELTIDLTAPVVTVTPLKTGDHNPALAGTVDDAAATVQVTVGGQTYTAINNGAGGWSLPNGAISMLLPSGTHDVAAAATDAAGNVGVDQTVDELVLTDAPTIVGASLAPDNAYIDVVFDQPVYGNSLGTLPLDANDLAPVFTRNGDTITGIDIVGLANAAGGELAGATTVRVSIVGAGQPTTGVGFVRIETADNAVFNAQGQAAQNCRTSDFRLNDPLNLLAGYDWSFEAFGGAAGPSYNPVGAVVNTAIAHTGAASLEFPDPTGSYLDRSVVLPNEAGAAPMTVLPNIRYVIRFWVYIKSNTVGAPSDVRINVGLKSATPGAPALDAASLVGALALNTWSKVEVLRATPVDATGPAWLILEARDFGISDSDVLIDDVRVVEE